MNARPRSGLSRSTPFILLALALGTSAACAGNSSGTPGTGGSTGTGSGGSSGTGTGGSTSTGTGGSGTGGSTATGTGGSGSTGTGGSSVTGTGGSAPGTGGAQGTGGAGVAGSAGGSSCPANATFCSGFEDPGLPTGAVYMVNAAPGDWSRDFAIDTSQHHSGVSSLLVKSGGDSGTSGSAYKMLAGPATAGAFWARFWVESDVVMGYSSGTSLPHNAFAGASIGDGPNSLTIQFAEDVGIAFNTGDNDVWPTGYGRLSGGGTNPYSLPAMTWACVELSFDGTNRVQQLFINGSQLIDATSYPSSTEAITYFAFGFEQFAGPSRHMWYDDVAVAPTRIGGCN